MFVWLRHLFQRRRASYWPAAARREWVGTRLCFRWTGSRCWFGWLIEWQRWQAALSSWGRRNATPISASRWYRTGSREPGRWAESIQYWHSGGEIGTWWWRA